MRPVTFIESLNIKEVMLYESEKDFRYHDYSKQPTPVYYMDGECAISEEINEVVVPIHHFVKSWLEIPENGGVEESPKHEHTYIAYSDDVKKFLEYPIDILKRQLDETEQQLTAYQDQLAEARKANESLIGDLRPYLNSGIFQRIKFLFTGKI